MTSYVRAELNYSTAEATRWLQLAKMVNAQPAIGEAWINGRIGAPQAVTFAKVHANRRVRDRLGEFVPVLLDHAEQLPHSDFATCIDTFVQLADSDGAHDDRDRAMTARRAHVSEVAGTLNIDAFGGDPLTAAEMVTIHRRFVEAEYQTDVAARRAEHGDDDLDHDLARTHAQRSFDALIAIFRSANAAAGGTTRTNSGEWAASPNKESTTSPADWTQSSPPHRLSRERKRQPSSWYLAATRSQIHI
jgi:hypothetical protein